MKKITYFILILFLFIILRIFLFEIYEVKFNSMKNTYHSGNRVLLIKNLYKINENDILIFNKNNETFIKRCVGLPGDTIKIISGKIYSNNKLIPIKKTILDSKNKVIDETFSKTEVYSTYKINWTIDNFGSYIIPKKGMSVELNSKNKLIYKNIIESEVASTKQRFNEKESQYTFVSNYYFVVGDNRNASVDSRYFGPIPEKKIKGKVILKLF